MMERLVLRFYEFKRENMSRYTQMRVECSGCSFIQEGEVNSCAGSMMMNFLWHKCIGKLVYRSDSH